MTTIRHLLRYGGLYLFVGLFYYAFCALAYGGAHHYGWNGVIGLHLAVALVAWCGYGVYHSDS